MGKFKLGQGPILWSHSFKTQQTTLIHPLVGALVTNDAQLTKVWVN